MDIMEKIREIYAALDRVQVHGRQNVNLVGFAMDTLDDMYAYLASQKPAEVHEETSQKPAEGHKEEE